MNLKWKAFIADTLLGIIVGTFLALFFLCGLSADAEARAPQEDILDYIEDVSEDYNICPELVQAVIEQESSWNPRAINGECIGLMQIDPSFHQERMDKLGVEDLTEPKGNILVGVDYLAELFEQHEDIYAVLMFYNAGYSTKYGLRAWECEKYSDYAVKVAERSQELERRDGK